ncbi:MAG: calcineurin-like phosphoesterase C-terminal domain-containing protein [Pirellulaceae bacterium]
MIRTYLLPLLALASVTQGVFAHEGHAHAANGLPNVLILGDSISMGYMKPLQVLLKGEANVVRPNENCGPSTNGLAKLEQWLGDSHWDVIHFNFGLHDLKHIDDSGKLVDVRQGHQQVSLEAYEANLIQITRRLKQTGAKLIWCTTTPVPEGAKGRVPGDELKYNLVAHRAVRRALGEERLVNDLHAFAAARLDAIQQPANVHFTSEGSAILAAEVARVIQAALSPDTRELLTAQGRVYHDVNANQIFDASDKPLAGVKVSNGEDIVLTDESGRYQLQIDADDSAVFVLKPAGYRTPVDEKQLPQFYYLHKPHGSPDVRFGGVSPTGPLPDSIDFPLYPQEEPQQFKAILFGDPQPRNIQEVDYVAHDVVDELIGTDASFGVTLGDIAFDDLSVFEPQARAIALIGIPWYNVLGNHDINYDTTSDKHSDETFERVFGPNYYSFDYGQVHFMVLDDVEWLVDEAGKTRYQGGLGGRQMRFIRKDLSMIPEDQLVVLMMHIPLDGVRDRHELYRLIEKRPFSVSISGTTHTHEHRFITSDDGWQGPKPHRHIVNVTVSGSWWSGMKDERGIPHTAMADGGPNGYSVLKFDGHQYKLDYKAAGRPKDYQMEIQAVDQVDSNQLANTEFFVNFFNGSSESNVMFRMNENDEWQPMTYAEELDPAYTATFEREEAARAAIKATGTDPNTQWLGLTKPKASTHLWKAKLPANLPVGTHWIHIKATDDFGQTFLDQRSIRVK